MENLKTKRNLSRSILRLPTLSDIPIAAALFLISRASVLGSFPAGTAFFAAACDPSAAYIYLPILLLGSISSGGAVIKYFLSAIVFWVISELKLRDGGKVKNAVRCGALTVICGIPSAAMSEATVAAVALLLAEGAVCAVMYSVFFNVHLLFKSRAKTLHRAVRAELVSLVIFICAMLAGLSQISLPLNISLVQIFGIYMILCTVMYLNLPYSVCFCLAVGFVSVKNSADAVMMMGIMGAGGIFASFLKHLKKQGITAGFMCGVAVCLLCMAGDYPIPISPFSLFFASALFLLTPAFVHSHIYAFFQGFFQIGCDENDLRIKEYVSRELKNISDAFKKLSARLSESFDNSPYSPKSFSSALFENVISRACADCSDHSRCWRENLGESCRHMFMMIDIMEEKGYCDMTNIPIVFSEKCKAPENFVSEFNHAYEIYKQDALHRFEAKHSRNLIAVQYEQISSLIKELSLAVENGFRFMKDEEDYIYRKLLAEKVPLSSVAVIENSASSPEVYLTPTERVGEERLTSLVSLAMDKPMRIYDESGDCLHFIADSLYYTEVGIKQRQREGQEVSGDTAVCFETRNNKFYVILCDGMGSGAEAAEESRITASLLKEFIMAGISSETAISMINVSLCLSVGRELFSTVDLLEIDLLTGAASLIKVGGAQSFVKHSGDLETICERSLPIGILDEVKITPIKRILKDGDAVVMVSDGVGEADFGSRRGEWIKRFMTGENSTAPELAKLILNEALKKIFPNSADDMTVIVVRLYKY